MTLAEQKKLLRKDLRNQCKALTSQEVAKASERINSLLMNEELWQHSRLIAAYWSDGSEPDLSQFCQWAIANGKQVFLPRFKAEIDGYELVEVINFANDLRSGRYGIMEPFAELDAVDDVKLLEMSWLVPGVGYDSRGNRLGRGKGYYDRLLKGRTGRVIGALFGFQKVDDLPVEEHDQRLDMVVNEEKIEQF